MHIDKCIRFYRVVKRLMYCGSVRLCQFDSSWIPFNTTDRVVRVAWLALNAKLTFLGPYLHSRRESILFPLPLKPSFSPVRVCHRGPRVNSAVQETAFLEIQIQ